MSQRDKYVKSLEAFGPAMIELARLYVERYPPGTTDPKVLDAVTVSVPLRAFLPMLALAYNLGTEEA